MPYVSTEEVKEVRQALKKALPDYKFSIVRRHSSSIDIAFMKGPALMSGFSQGHDVNPFWYKTQKNRDTNTPVYNEQQILLLEKLFTTVQTTCPNRTISEDGDYGRIPSYYLNVSIGKWNKEYEVK